MNRRLLSDSGAINLVKVIFFGAIIALGYLSWVYVPAWLDYFGVRKAVRVACNAAYVQRNEEAVRSTIMREWRDLKVQDGFVKSDGSIETKPTPFDRIENIDVALSADPPAVTVSVR